MLRNIFDSARQPLGLEFFSFQRDVQFLQDLSNKSTGDLFEQLGLMLIGVREIVTSTEKRSLRNHQARSISQALDGIMAIYLALLVRDKSSATRLKSLMGAYHLLNRP